MADSAGVRKDLIIVATGEALVAEEVDGLVLDAGDVLLGLDVLQAVSLVPTSGEDIEGDLAADGVAVLRGSGELCVTRVLFALAQNLRQTVVREFLLQGLDHIPTNVVNLVIANAVVS